MRSVTVAGFALLLSSGTAFASGGLSCEGGGKAEFSIEAGVTRGMGAPVFNLRGTIQVSDRSVSPDLRKISVTEEHLAQYWLDGEELRLLVYRERATGDHGSVELTVRTRIADEGSYAGKYEIAVFDTKDDKSGEGRTYRARGNVSCFVE